MSRENVEVVQRAIAAVNARDVDGYLACCTEDIELRTPLAELEGSYVGPDAIRHFFADIRDAGPDFHLTIERVQPIGADRVLAMMRATASGRASGIGSDTPTANVYDLVDGRIKRIRIFVDREQALEAVGLRE
jgi:ketosteroid isomerase-like protein